jgi:hypothetical protein
VYDIGRAALIAHKEAAGRPQDNFDVEYARNAEVTASSWLESVTA